MKLFQSMDKLMIILIELGYSKKWTKLKIKECANNKFLEIMLKIQNL
jgi:hypothetical protein